MAIAVVCVVGDFGLTLDDTEFHTIIAAIHCRSDIIFSSTVLDSVADG